MNYAYARVSAKDQNLQRQIAAFSEFGIEKSRIFSEKKSGKDLIDTFIYRVILYDDKMKVLFHLKGGQQGELLLNLIFPDYPDGHGNDGENARKMPENEKETDKAVSNSDVNAECAYTSRLVEIRGVEPLTS